MAKEMKLETFTGNMPPISGEGRKARYDEIVRGVAAMLETQRNSGTPQWARWTNPPPTLKKARETLVDRAGQLRLNVGGESLRIAKAKDDAGGFIVWVDASKAAMQAPSSTASGGVKVAATQKPIAEPRSQAAALGDPRLIKIAKWLSRRPHSEASTSDTMQSTGASITILEQMETAGLAVIGKDKVSGRKVISLTDAGIEAAEGSSHG